LVVKEMGVRRGTVGALQSKLFDEFGILNLDWLEGMMVSSVALTLAMSGGRTTVALLVRTCLANSCSAVPSAPEQVRSTRCPKCCCLRARL
jgi:hypothetical protein